MKANRITIFIIITLLMVSMLSYFLPKPKILTDLDEEFSTVPLKIIGTVPEWLNGTLVRNGPVNFAINGEKNRHWFDGLAMLHAFSFHEGEVNYTNQFVRSQAYQTVFEDGSLHYGGFASDPSRSLFKRLYTWFVPNNNSEIPNANVNVAKIAEQFVALTETPLPVKFDLNTLKTLGVLDYQDELPHNKCWESAHPHYDSLKKETLNYLIEYGSISHYILYKIKDGSNSREIIAKIPVQDPAYMHSFAVTKNYIVLTEFPFVIKFQDLIGKKQAFIKNFVWEPERGTQFIVINRHNGELVGKYRTVPFFAFHHANAFEKDNQLFFDIVCYDDAGIIQSIADHNRATSEKENRSPTRLVRFNLSLHTGEISSDVLFKKFHEFPRINEIYDGLPYRYLYLADSRDAMLVNEIRPLYKIDTHNKISWEWSQEGCFVGEPVFVPHPNASKEDQGVILSVVFDAENYHSFLLILDAHTFEEIGRAPAPHIIPAGLHGQFFK